MATSQTTQFHTYIHYWNVNWFLLLFSDCRSNESRILACGRTTRITKASWKKRMAIKTMRKDSFMEPVSRLSVTLKRVDLIAAMQEKMVNHLLQSQFSQFTFHDYTLKWCIY